MTDSPNPLREGEKVSAPGFSPQSLGLAVVLSALATLVVLLVVFHLLGLAPWSSPVLVQHGKVKVKGESMGIVYYEIPYASPPQVLAAYEVNLGPGHVSKCTVVDQNELGFVWQLLVDGRAEPPPSDSNLKANWQDSLKQAEFTWEAKGIKGNPGAATTKLSLPQNPSMTVTVEGEDYLGLPKGNTSNEKVVHYKVRFASPPHMTFPDGIIYGYKITDQKAESFKLQRVVLQEDREKYKFDPLAKGVQVGPAPPWELFASSTLRWKAEGQPAK